MGIINARPKLEPDEVLRWKARANHVQGPSYALYGMTSAAGGQLVVTNRRVFFQPSRVDRATGAKRWEVSHEAITGFEVVGRNEDVFAGGMRNRLGIQTADGTEVFVVNGLEKKMTELRALILGR